MNGKRARMVAGLAAPHLRQGEQIEMTVYANVGTLSLKKIAMTATAVAVATAGTMTAFKRPRKTYLSITNQRLMFFDGETMSGRPGRLLFTLPREAVTVSEVHKGLIMTKGKLAIAGQEQGLSLVFPTNAKRGGERALAALSAAAAPV